MKAEAKRTFKSRGKKPWQIALTLSGEIALLPLLLALVSARDKPAAQPLEGEGQVAGPGTFVRAARPEGPTLPMDSGIALEPAAVGTEPVGLVVMQAPDPGPVSADAPGVPVVQPEADAEVDVPSVAPAPSDPVTVTVNTSADSVQIDVQVVCDGCDVSVTVDVASPIVEQPAVEPLPRENPGS